MGPPSSADDSTAPAPRLRRSIRTLDTRRDELLGTLAVDVDKGGGGQGVDGLEDLLSLPALVEANSREVAG